MTTIDTQAKNIIAAILAERGWEEDYRNMSFGSWWHIELPVAVGHVIEHVGLDEAKQYARREILKCLSDMSIS